MNVLNLFIMGQVLFQILGLLLAPLIAFNVALTTASIAWQYCTPYDFTPLVRAGTVITGIAFFYVVAEEAWNFTEHLHREIEANFSWFKADEDAQAAPALRRYREIAAWSVRTQKILRRWLEALLIFSGTLLAAVGDLIGYRLAPFIG
jgi:hypothetical protein